MGISKTELFTDYQNEIAILAKVLGHPARIAILQHLIKIDNCICGDLVLETGLSQPTISQHLNELKQVGLIKGSISGVSRCYCIDNERWQYVKSLFNDFFNQNAPKLNCCN